MSEYDFSDLKNWNLSASSTNSEILLESNKVKYFVSLETREVVRLNSEDGDTTGIISLESLREIRRYLKNL